jgi:2-methylisocitrate lyase-like PEP mutase family enzyme
MISASEKRAALAKRVRAREFLVAPGVFDLISARTADALDFAALYMTGYGISASHLGLPDAGLASFTEMAARARAIAEATRTPLVADADTGYGGLLNVHHTVRGYEAAGVAGIQIEDQEFPKKCGHTPGRRVVPLEDMTRKIRVAVDARTDPDLLIVARTDARTGLGLDEALRRAEAFVEAGADVIFVESPETEEEFARVGEVVDAPLLANMVEGGRSPVLPADVLAQMGFTIAIYPATGFCAAAAALHSAYAHLRHAGTSSRLPVPLTELGDMHTLMGFEAVWEFERRWADEESGQR